MNTRLIVRTLSLRAATVAALLVAGTLAGTAASAQYREGAVFSSTNSTIANSVVMFRRAADGSLTPYGEFFTGGTGTGGGLANSGAVILSADNKWLFAVNAASNDISVFSVRQRSLALVSRTPSGGTTPISLTTYNNALYVVNAGTPNTIAGFIIGKKGGLTPIPGSIRSLSAATTKPAEIKFSPFGDLLVVTEQNTNLIDVFAVDAKGVAGAAVTTPSATAHPFGFDFDPAGHLLLSEATVNATSSYFVSPYGALPISGGVLDGEMGACWVVSSPNGQYAWTSNTASNSISAYDVTRSGRLSLISASGIAATFPTGSKPTDEEVDGYGHFYTLLSGTGAVAAFRINRDGSLTAINTTASFGAGMTGLAATK